MVRWSAGPLVWKGCEREGISDYVGRAPTRNNAQPQTWEVRILVISQSRERHPGSMFAYAATFIPIVGSMLTPDGTRTFRITVLRDVDSSY